MSARTDTSEDFAPRPRVLTRLLLPAALLVLAVLAAVAVVRLPPHLACGGLGSGLVERGGECIGVTDGGPAFLPGPEELHEEYRRIQSLIKAENDRVADDGRPSVKVALVSTLTPDTGGPLSPEQILHSLRGAYVAQMRANHGEEARLGDPGLQIRLHLANAGKVQDKWEPVVEELIGMTDDRAPLIAVVGWGLSVQDTEDAAARLSEAGIPMVSSVASATGLNHSTIPGLVRITPSNDDFVRALAEYADARPDLSRAALVLDENSEDRHVNTLTEAFRAHFGDRIVSEEPFGGTTVGDEYRYVEFFNIVQNVCGTGAEMVLFSGRTANLHDFLDRLRGRYCTERPVTVLFVETGPVIAEEDVRPLDDSDITVVQASANDPRWSLEEDSGAPAGFAPFYRAHQEYLGGQGLPAELSDGYALAHHDALMTAVLAIRSQYSERRGELPSSAQIRPALFQLKDGNSVKAASGSLQFPAARAGDPGGRPVPVIEIPDRGTGHPVHHTPLE
ncbi:ABC transporter substrate-binding protein [Streptomyces aidingensis]|uniref:ABC-type branched-chain amino acid transport system, substrate-binding protein n=1 Tax=Streptomyces aidingensis TaxID=910347 RepID=A0A1I1N289_9ACTN|nr:ABC transporter substrate-binding protein [Streptomyces aidingensis]SFC89608.1 ABC-type branched-chain amino acid transport system, substrate-binding protein [Streptomyces aidingensis]